MQQPSILSRPIKLHWAGWETDTYRLQQAGWQLSAEQDVYRDGMRIALQHQGAQVQGMSDTVRYEYQHALHDASPDYWRHVTLPVRLMARQIMYEVVSGVDFSAFTPVDAIPQMVNRRIERMEDLVHFAAPLARTQQLIVPDEDVSTLMDRILKMQEPGRIERIRRDLQDEGALRRQQAVHAQIISFPVAA